MRLWNVHDSLASELLEQRQRAGVYVGLAGTIFVASLAAPFNADLLRLVSRDSLTVQLYLAFLMFTFAVAVISVAGLNAGLPWERHGPIELPGWLGSLLLGAATRGPYAERLRRTHDDGSLTYRRYQRLGKEGRTQATQLISILSTVTNDDLAWRILRLSEQLHQVRVWRRFVISTAFVDMLLFGTATILTVASALNRTVPELLASVAAVLVLVVAIALMLRRIPG